MNEESDCIFGRIQLYSHWEIAAVFTKGMGPTMGIFESQKRELHSRQLRIDDLRTNE
ncbi:hypothetical protein [Rhodoferax sp. PAMC 29310]|uniref:hypothetical protein n=1 Tax=Rhodoferax sp. PAMC 29310 TaxID=2822760 RepID=UPI001B33B4F6|nr:hypothetical protein [Rhodoferax sp. PAMC 29310]